MSEVNMTTSGWCATRCADGGSESVRIRYEEFEEYCQAYLKRRDEDMVEGEAGRDLSWLAYSGGWRWTGAVMANGTRYDCTAGMERRFGVVVDTKRLMGMDGATLADSVVEDDGDEALDRADCSQTVVLHQSILYSATWKVPVLWFSAHTRAGEPLGASDLLNLRIIHHSGSLDSSHPFLHHDTHSRPRTNMHDSLTIHDPPAPISLDHSPFPPLSISDHPRTSLPSFFLHPCNTHTALHLLLSTPPSCQPDPSTSQCPSRYMCAFVSLCASAVEMRAS